MAAKLTAEERARIVRLLRDGKSQNAIAKDVGRSQQTVGRVAKAEGIQSVNPAPKKANEARSLFAEIDRKEIVAEMLQKGRDILKKAADAREYKDAVTGLGISVDKHLLISGEATSRSENVDPSRRERFRKSLDELAERRRLAGGR